MLLKQLIRDMIRERFHLNASRREIRSENSGGTYRNSGVTYRNSGVIYRTMIFSALLHTCSSACGMTSELLAAVQTDFGWRLEPLVVQQSAMAGLSSIFSNATLAEGLSLVAGMAELSSAGEDMELAVMQAELQALKQEVDCATVTLSDAAWDEVEDDDLRLILNVQAGLGGRMSGCKGYHCRAW